MARRWALFLTAAASRFEASLEALTARFRAELDNAPDGILDLNEAAIKLDGSFCKTMAAKLKILNLQSGLSFACQLSSVESTILRTCSKVLG